MKANTLDAIDEYIRQVETSVGGRSLSATPDKRSFVNLAYAYCIVRIRELRVLAETDCVYASAATARAVLEAVVTGRLAYRGSDEQFASILCNVAHDRKRLLQGIFYDPTEQLPEEYEVPEGEDVIYDWLTSAGFDARRGMSFKDMALHLDRIDLLGPDNSWSYRYAAEFAELSIASHGGGNSISMAASSGSGFHHGSPLSTELSLQMSWHWLRYIEALVSPTPPIEQLGDWIEESLMGNDVSDYPTLRRMLGI